MAFKLRDFFDELPVFATGSLGSLFYRGGNGVLVDLPPGDEGDVLTVVSGVPAYAAPGAASVPAASFLTLGTHAGLSDERVFTPSARFSATDGGAGQAYDLDLADNIKFARLVFGFDNGSTALAVGSKVSLPNAPGGTVVGWYIDAPDEAGTITFGLKVGANRAGLTSIVASAPPTISSSGQEASSTTLTGWTSSVTAGHKWEAEVTACATITNVSLVVIVRRS